MYCLFHLKKICSVPESAGQLLFISKKSFLSITNSRKANTFKPRKITILHRIQKKILRGVLLLRNSAPVIISLKRITPQSHYGAVIKNVGRETITGAVRNIRVRAAPVRGTLYFIFQIVQK